MSQKRYRRVEKSESQTQYSSSRPGRPGRGNPTPKPNYQWVSSAKVRGRGGDSESAGFHPPPPSDHSSTNSRKNSDGQGDRSTIPGANSEPYAVQNASLEKSQLSGTSDASTSKALVRYSLRYSKRDTKKVSRAVYSQSQPETSGSATTGAPLKDNPSRRASPQFRNSQGFVNEMQADHKSGKRVTAIATSSVSSKQQRMKETKKESPLLQSKEDWEHKSETHNLPPKAKRHIRANHSSSNSGETDKSSMSSKQLQKQDHEPFKNENPHVQPKHDLEVSKDENLLQSKRDLVQYRDETPGPWPKHDLEQSKSATPYLQPRIKGYNHMQWKLSKPGTTVPMPSFSSKQEPERHVEQSNTKTPCLKAVEDFEESKDGTLHPQSMVKRNIQVHCNFLKSDGTVSTSCISGRKKQKEDLKQSGKETPNLQPVAERDTHNMGVSAATVVASTQDVALAVPEVPVATSSFQQSHISNGLDIFGLHTWTPGMTSTSFQMSVPLPCGNSSQVLQPPFFPSFQPYPLQPQGMMHYGNRCNFPPQVGHQLGSQFGNFNGISSNYVHNYLKKPTSHRSVKITHPETNEELILDNSANRRLDGGSSGPMAHHHIVLQPQPVACGPSPPMNCFSHVQPNSFSFQCPTSLPFRSSQMLSRTSKLGLNTLGIHDIAVATNTRYAALASIPVSETLREENKSHVSVRSATNDRNQATKPMVTIKAGEQGESNYCSQGFVELPKSVATSAVSAMPLGTSFATVSVEAVPLRKGAVIAIDDGKTIAPICGPDDIMKEFRDLSKKHGFQSHNLPQAETSDFPDNSNVESSEVGECHNNTLSRPKEIKVSRSPLSSEPSIPGSLKLEVINPEANNSLVDSYASSPVTSWVCLPGAQVGFPCASVEVSSDLQTGKDLIHGVSSKYIGQNIKMDNAAAVEDVENHNYAPSGIRIDAKREELSEQQGTNLFEQPFLCSICRDGSLNNMRSLEVNQHTVKDPSFAGTSASDKHVISVFEQDGSHGSIDTWNSVAEKTGDSSVTCATSLSHGTDSLFGSPILDSSKEHPGFGVEALESKAEPVKGNEISLSKSRYENHEEDDPISNSIMMKGVSFRGMQKREENLYKADAAEASADLFMAYKDRDQMLQFSDISDGRGDRANINPRQTFSFSNEETVGAKDNVKGKTEPGYLEGVEISTSELEISNKFEVHQSRDAALDDTESSGRKSYSRDFLLKLSKQFTEFPAGFQLANDVAEVLIVSPKASIEHVDRNSHPYFDGSSVSSSLEHHGHRKDGNRRWTKSPSLIAFATKQHFGINEAASSFHPGRGGTYSRNLHGQVPSRDAVGIFTGLLPHPASQGGRSRKGDGVDLWHQATASQRNLISSPKSPLQKMHKAEEKYQVHKVMDSEEVKQRRLKAILNKLTPQNFDRLFQQVKEVNIDTAVTLAGLISQIFDKALMEPTFSEMYANFCYHLASELPDFVEGREKITFKRLLLNKCQEEFERGEREQAEANRTDRNGEVRLSEEEREDNRIHARRRMLGNIRLIGELYKKKMLTERIMHECIEKLLRDDQFPDEEDIEALCKLMCTIGEIIDHPKAKEHMDAYFEVMLNLSNNRELSTRIRFILKDVIDMRKNKWQQKRKVEGPKKLEELHSDAAQERQAVSRQLSYTPSTFSSSKRVSTDSGSRPSTFRSPRKSERDAYRAMSSKNRGFAGQDLRLEDRKLYQHEPLSVPFPHRLSDDNIVTLDLQGGLTKGMPLRDPTMFHGSPLADSHTGFVESRKISTDQNGYSSITERPSNNLRQQVTPKYAPDSFMQATCYDPSNRQGSYVHRGSTSFGRSLMTRTMSNPSRPALSSRVSSGNRWSDEHLREMSVAAIREFYCTGNENEVFQCVGDLNSPNIYPSMICIWVKDSFERKDRERDLLTGLLVSLTKSGAGVLTTSQLIRGFELVLATLEVAFTDAAKAAVFLGQLLGKIVAKNVLSLKEIKRLVQQYGKLSGHPPQNKLGYEVMKIAFETIRSERGESVLRGMCRRSNVQLNDFCPSRALMQ